MPLILGMFSSEKGGRTPLWEKALENYREELPRKEDYVYIVEQKDTFEE